MTSTPSTSIGSADLWAQFGLPGLVIFALFIVLIFTIWYLVSRVDKMSESNNKTVTTLADNHKQERDEWRKESSEQMKEFRFALQRLADGLYDLKRKE